MINRHAHRTSPALLATVACLAAVALAGCGGGGSSSSSAAASASSSSSAASAAAASVSPSAATVSTSSVAVGQASGTGSAATPTAGAGTPSSGSYAYAAALLPLAQAWQAAAQHYDNLVARGATLSVIATSSGVFVTATNKFADSIAALHPPAGAAGAQAALVTAIRALGSDVKELQTAAVNHDPTAATDAEHKVGPDGTAVSQAVLALAKASGQGG